MDEVVKSPGGDQKKEPEFRVSHRDAVRSGNGLDELRRIGKIENPAEKLKALYDAASLFGVRVYRLES